VTKPKKGAPYLDINFSFKALEGVKGCKNLAGRMGRGKGSSETSRVGKKNRGIFPRAPIQREGQELGNRYPDYRGEVC